MAASFADLLRTARKRAGLSQAALARAAGLTGSYISVLESQRRPPPRPRVIRALAKALDTRARPLLDAAALERSPPSVRRRMERMRKERRRVHRTRDRLLTTTLFHIARTPRAVEPLAGFLDLPPEQRSLLQRLVGKVREVENVGEAAARADDLLEDATPADRDALVRVLPEALAGEPSAAGVHGAAPEGTQDGAPPQSTPATAPVAIHEHLDREAPPLGHHHVDAELWSRGAFLWRVTGDDAWPAVEPGDLVLVAPRRTPRDGDLVAWRLEDREGVGRYARRGERVRVEFPRPEVVPVALEDEEEAVVGVVTWLLRRLR